MTTAFGQANGNKYNPSTPSVKLSYATPDLAINKYGKQLRTGYAFQGVGLALTAVGAVVLTNDDKKDVAYALGGVGLLSMLVGQFVIWDAAKHLRVSTDGANIKVVYKLD